MTKAAKFYIDGFRSMTWGRTLWVIVLIKLAIMFLVLKPLFFPRVLNRFDSGESRARHVLEQLTDDHYDIGNE